MRFYFAICILIFITASTHADSVKLKKLLAKISEKSIDTAHVSALVNLIDYYEGNNNDSAFYYSNKALPAIEAYGKSCGRNSFYIHQLVYFHINTGMIYKSNGDYKQALQHLFEAEKIAANSRLKTDLAQVYNNTGIIFRNAGYAAKAIEMYTKSLSISQQLKDTLLIGECFINLAVVYRSKKDYTKALAFNTKALGIFSKLNHQDYIGQIYNNMGVVYKHLQDYDSALICYTKSYAIHKALNNIEQTALTCNNLGNIYRLKKEYSNAEKSLLEGKMLSEKCSSAKKLGDALSRLGTLYYEMHNLDLAKQYLIQAIEICEKKQLHDALIETYSTLKKVALERKNYEEAYYALEKENAYKDSLNSKERQDEFDKNALIIELRMMQITDSINHLNKGEINRLIDKEKESRNFSSKIIYWTAGILGALLILIVVFWLYLKRK